MSKKPIKPLTVRQLKEIINAIPDDMVTDAFVLVTHAGGEVEYIISRVGQFSFVPNLTFQIMTNKYGLAKSSTQEER